MCKYIEESLIMENIPKVKVINERNKMKVCKEGKRASERGRQYFINYILEPCIYQQIKERVNFDVCVCVCSRFLSTNLQNIHVYVYTMAVGNFESLSLTIN